MTNQAIDREVHYRFGKFSYLLCSILTLLIGTAFTGSSRVSVIFFCLLFSAVLLTAVISICQRHKTLGIGLTIVFLMLVMNVSSFLFHSDSLTILHNILVIIFLAFVFYHVLSAVFDDNQVTLDTIIGTVCLYLLAGLFWAYLYSMIIVIDPAAFRYDLVSSTSETVTLSNSNLQPLIYLSFVTMATLGYGDIIPESGPAQTACYLQAVFSQFYFAILVSRLVSLYISSVSRENQDRLNSQS